jgi:TRAP-type C4-dicarboxylate transport system permease small subunit
METAKKGIAIGFGVCVIIFAILAILGIWEVVDPEITMKALSTLGVVLIATFIGSVILNNLSKKN